MTTLVTKEKIMKTVVKGTRKHTAIAPCEPTFKP